MTLLYPDVSNNQWSSDRELVDFLGQLKPSGLFGVVHKVSEGSYFADAYWPVCRSWCENNDLSWLGYHYVTTDDPRAQVNVWVGNHGGSNVMLDFEANSGGINNLWAVVNAFNAVGVNVSMAYLPNWYWQGHMGSPDLASLSANQITLVSSNYPVGGGSAWDIYNAAGGDGGPGWHGYGGATPAVWQFTDQASIAGLAVDCNAYKGDNLDALFTGGIF